jgi:hypothetical protein
MPGVGAGGGSVVLGPVGVVAGGVIGAVLGSAVQTSLGGGITVPDVVAMFPCPNVDCTPGSVAPRSMACDAWACRSQCGEIGASMPAFAAARRTSPWTARWQPPPNR